MRFGRIFCPIDTVACTAAALAIGMAMPGSPAVAETLREALAAAYRNNPSLEAERSRLRATDENVAIANSRYRPRINAGGALTWSQTTIDPAASTPPPVIIGPTGTISEAGISRHANYGIGLTQPLFSGFQIKNQVKIAEAGVLAGRETLRGTEGAIFTETVTAFANVTAIRKILKFHEQNASLMEKNVRSAKERLAFNELTNTDVAQARYRLTLAQSLVTSTRADLKTARGAYTAVVGHEPSNLVDPAFPGGLPKSLADALAIAARENPLIVGILRREEAARHNVELIRGRLLPTVSLAAAWGKDHDLERDATTESKAVAGFVSVPLYEGGEIRALVRQAKQLHLSELQTVDAVRAQVQQAVTAAWSQYEAAKARVDLARQQISTSVAALEGVRREETLGQRTLLDVLNGQQENLDAQVTLVLAQRNYLVAAFVVLAQIGRLDASQLELNPVYDPTVHYDEVHRKWFGMTISYPDGRTEVVKAPHIK